ncbi:MAG: (Fe-S)-binding protein [Planctomycetes bacterium]|nr:(Fe-S)-binding protein [Planctomycetota bacterium]
MKVALYSTCLAEHFNTSIVENSIFVLRKLGCTVEIPKGQTCCGQPAFNAGFWDTAKIGAKKVLNMLKTMKSDYLVVPSGSCTYMIREHYRKLLDEKDFSYLEKVYEFSQFITDVLQVDEIPGSEFSGVVAYHDSCHLLRGMKVDEGPRKLLRNVKGLKLLTLDEEKQCCGFGGVFSIKHPEISVKMGERKLDLLQKSGASTLTAGDLGCLMHLKGLISQRKLPFQVLHYAEILGS